MQKMMERSEESENRKDKLVQRGFAVGNQLAVNPWLGFVLLWKGEWKRGSRRMIVSFGMIDGGSRYSGCGGVGESLCAIERFFYCSRKFAIY